MKCIFRNALEGPGPISRPWAKEKIRANAVMIFLFLHAHSLSHLDDIFSLAMGGLLALDLMPSHHDSIKLLRVETCRQIVESKAK